MTDKELIEKIRSGNEEALELIIDRYYADIFRFCLYMVRVEADAYDLTQETFLKFIKYGRSYRHRNLKGYLLTIARNLCITYFQQRREVVSLDEWKQSKDLAYRRDDFQEAESSVWLRTLLGGLSQEIREVVILRIYEELKFREIAEIMESNISTTKSRFRLGTQQLKKQMEEDGYGATRDEKSISDS